MNARDATVRRRFPAGEWAFIACALFVLLTVILGALSDEDGTTRERPAALPAETAEAQQTAELSDAQLVIQSYLLATVIVSCFWLLARRLRRRPVLGQAELPAARWNEWDVVKAACAYVFLSSGFFAVAPKGGPGQQVVVDGLAKLAAVVVILYVVRSRGQEPREAFGLGLAGLPDRVMGALAVFFACWPLMLALKLLSAEVFEGLPGEPTSQELVKALRDSPSSLLVVQITVAALVVAPLAEELFFRGFLYRLVRRRVRPALAMITVGVIFGLFHGPMAVKAPVALLGILLCYLYEKTGRLAVPMAVHFVFNLVTVALLLAARSS